MNTNTTANIQEPTSKIIKDNMFYYGIRIMLLVLGAYIGYLIVNYFITPSILYPRCFTDTNDCSQINLYLYQNTFLAQEKISQVWFWYNGFKLYVYGQAPEICKTDYQAVNVFTISKQGNTLTFTPFPNECISEIDTIVDYYSNLTTFKTFYVRRRDASEINTIFNIINDMYLNGIFIL